MKPGYANVVSFGLALATLSSTRAATPRPPNTPAVWIAYNMTVDLHDMPKRYGCEDLRDKFRDMLLSIGARQDLKVVPFRCYEWSPGVHLQFSLPEVVPDRLLRYPDSQAGSEAVRIEPGRPRSLDAGDCALMRQVKDTLFAALPVRVVSYRLTCLAPPSRPPAFRMSLQALTATSRSSEQVAIRAGRNTSPPEAPAASQHHG
jgi:hypothetical protein